MARPQHGTLSEMIIDEIALEGLEGITLQGLWVRLSHNLKLELPLLDSFKSEVWKFILKFSDSLEFYELPESKPQYEILNRFNILNGKLLESPIIIDGEKEDKFNNYILKYKPIEKDGVRGSCEFYDERVKILIDTLKMMKIKDIERKWDNKFVIVGSQALRENAIFLSNVFKPTHISLSCYCMLEIIGRSRYNGELCAGKNSLTRYIKDTQLLYNLRNVLLKHNLITKQPIEQKCHDRYVCSYILHLTRFEVKITTRTENLLNIIYDIIKKQPKLTIPLVDLKKQMPSDYIKIFKKVRGLEKFERYIDTFNVPNSVAYNNVIRNTKKKSKADPERLVMCLKLKNSDITVNDLLEIIKEDVTKDEEDDECLQYNERCIDTPIFEQVYDVIDSYGCKGCTSMEIKQRLGLTKYFLRKVLKDLFHIKYVIRFVKEVGKQRKYAYISMNNAKKYEKELILNVDAASAISAFKSNMSTINNKIPFIDYSHNKTDCIFDDSVMEQTITELLRDDDNHIEEISQNKKDDIEIENTLNSELVTESYEENSLISKNEISTTEQSSNTNILEESEQVLSYLDVVNDTVTIEDIEVESSKLERIQKLDKIKEEFPAMKIKILAVSRRSKINSNAVMTPRQLTRSNLIVDTVNDSQIIQLGKVYNVIKSVELHSGYKDQCCKKSLVRQINWLTTNKVIKLFEVIYQLDEYSKIVKFLCSPNITKDSPQFQKELKNIGSSFYLHVAERYVDKYRKQFDDNLSILKTIEQKKQTKCTEPKTIHLKHGKFVRAQYIHQLLYHVAYDLNPGTKPLKLTDEIINEWLSLYPYLKINEIREKLPPIYSSKIDFKMFIPPVPHNNYDKGWILFEDVWFRLPLSIALKLFRFNNLDYNDDIKYYTENPILQHVPVILLPINVQASFSPKTLINSMSYYHHALKVLCCASLIQFGNENNFRKTWVFVNRHAALKNTMILKNDNETSSNNHEIHFTFNSYSMVQCYWNKLSEICLLTPIKSLQCVKKISKKSDTFPEIPTVSYEMAKKLDKGYLPLGDNLGAAGFHSLLYINLRRNWIIPTTDIDPYKRTYLGRVASVVNNQDNKIAKLLKQKSTILSNTKSKVKRAIATVTKSSSTKAVIIKRQQASLRVRAEKINKYKSKNHEADEIDLKALKKMEKLRSVWSQEEDQLLMICRTVLLHWENPFLFRVINQYIVRDIMHWSLKISHNKTSIACRRRMNYLKKNKIISQNISHWALELKRNEYIKKNFGENFIHDLRAMYPDDLEYGNALRVYFVQLVYYLQKIIKDGSIQGTNNTKNLALPPTLREFEKRYHEYIPDEMFNTKLNCILYGKPKNIEDIEVSTIDLIIHSSMCCMKEKTSYNVQLFDIYKMYNDKTLLKAFRNAQNDHMISKLKIRGSTGPKSSLSGYVLSHRYQISLLEWLPYETLNEFFENFCNMYQRLFDMKLLPEQRNNVFTSVNSGGYLLLIDSLNFYDKIAIDIKIPKKLFTIDPQQANYGETEKILEHFRHIFENAPDYDYLKILEDSDYTDTTNTIIATNNIEKDDSQTTDTALAGTISSKMGKDISKFNEIVTKKNRKCKANIKFNLNENLQIIDYSPYEILTKLDDKYLHFYCGLQNLNRTIDLNVINANNLNLCPFALAKSDYNDHMYSNCILSDNSSIFIENDDTESLVYKIRDIAKEVQDEINNLIQINFQDQYEFISNEILLTTDNLMQIFTRYQKLINKQIDLLNKKDLGKSSYATASINKFNSIDMIALTKNLLEYDHQYPDDKLPLFEDEFSSNKEYHEAANDEEAEEESKLDKINELLVVNLPEIYVTCKNHDEEFIEYDGIKIPAILKNVIARFSGIIEQLTRDCDFTVQATIETVDLEAELLKRHFTKTERFITQNILEFLKSCQLGATSTELRNKYGNENLLVKYLNVLRECNLVMRVGVEEWTYVHSIHVRPWVIYSYHIKRLERETLNPQINSEYAGKLKTLCNRKRKSEDTSKEDEPTMKKTNLDLIPRNVKKEQSVEIDQEKEQIIIEKEECIPGTSFAGPRESKRILKSVQKFSSDEPKGKLSLNNKQVIVIRPYPWIRINGSLNRRVFDKWIGTILIKCISKCGILVKDLFKRFNYLQPVCILYLLEVLQKLDCVVLKKYVAKKTTLFTSYEEAEIGLATEFSNLDNVFVECLPHAMTILTLFIGKKKYKVDFV